jgi:ABC-type uncharacterized transport system permease subunit
MDVLLVQGLLASAVRLSTPLVFAALGGLYSERSGVINIALEGILLVGAFAGAAATYYAGNPWIGLLAGMAAGFLTGLLHGWVTVYGQADQIVAGTALNILAVGLTATIGKPLFGVTGSTPGLPLESRFHEWALPGLSRIPFLGPVFFEHIPLVYLGGIAAIVTHLILSRTPVGLHLRAAGGGPAVADASGIPVRRIRLLAVATGAAIAAIGGVFLSVGHASAFARNMSAGRGFIALAALILGNWKPLPVLGAAALFGLGDAVAIALQGVEVPGLGPVPVQFVQMVPYVLTLIVLAGFAGRTQPPKALGQPYPE